MYPMYPRMKKGRNFSTTHYWHLRDRYTFQCLQLQKYFDIAHIHGNNHCGRIKSGLPIILEITFFNKKYSPVKKEYIESFPIENLDAPNNPAEKDLAFQFYIE